MVFGIIRQMNENLRRRIRRAFLAEPEKTPERIAIFMASVLLVSIIVTYNVLYEKRKKEEGVQPKTIMDLYRERNAKKRLEHLELQQNIAKSRNSMKSTPVEEP